jgi:hypothetical protein
MQDANTTFYELTAGARGLFRPMLISFRYKHVRGMGSMVCSLANQQTNMLARRIHPLVIGIFDMPWICLWA